MSATHLVVFADDDPGLVHLDTTDPEAIARVLGIKGIRYARHAPPAEAASLDDDALLALMEDTLAGWREEAGFASQDIVSLRPDHPQREALRAKFLDEHIHAEDEVRWFVDGRGWFFLHLGTEVWRVQCEAGDRIDVPAGTKHWFDMGEAPTFRAVRLFTNPEGWVAQWTGSDVSDPFRAPEAA